MVQTVLIVLLALLLGADFKGGVIGVIVMFFIGALLASSVASLSNAVGAARPPARDGDRRRQLLPAAAHLPLDRDDAEEPAAALDADGDQVQPGQLGGRGAPARRRCRRPTGASSARASRCWRRLAIVARLRRLTRVRALPAVAVTDGPGTLCRGLPDSAPALTLPAPARSPAPESRRCPRRS